MIPDLKLIETQHFSSSFVKLLDTYKFVRLKVKFKILIEKLCIIVL